MSQPAFSTPFEAVELMINYVTWERALGFDGHAQQSYATPKQVRCRQESGSILGVGGLQVKRQTDYTVQEPNWVLIFSGDDADAIQFGMFDRFTPDSVGDTGTEPLQPISINSVHGANFDNAHHWLIVVML